MKNAKKPNIMMALKSLPYTFSLLYNNDKKYLLLMLLEAAAFSIDKYPALLLMKYTIDALTKNIAYSDYVMVIIPLIAIMFALQMIRVVINTSRPCRDQVVTENLFSAFFTQCMKIDYQTLESKEMQDKKELAKFITNRKIAAIGWYFVEMFSSLTALIIATIFMMRISIIVLVIVVSGLLIKSYFANRHTEKTLPITKRQVIDNRYLSYLYRIGSDYEYVKEFRIFNYKKNLHNTISESKNKYIEANDRVLKYDLFHSIAGSIEDFIIKLLSFGIMGFSCLKSIVTISDFTFIIGLVNDYISYSNSFTTSCKRYVEAVAYIEHYIGFMNYKNTLSLPEESGRHISPKSHVIEFQNVYFKYPNSNDYAIKNVSLKLHVPIKISLVGRNGAGKSTLIKLLLRLYKPDEGQITIDGVSIYEYSNEEYAMLFSSVFQDYALFAFSVSDNITSFDMNIEQGLFSRISDETGVVDFICNYPKRYETYFTNAYSNDGVEFSGGEQQKIALARSIYKRNAQFFILDEPTATYDADAEYQLYKKYENILYDKASVFISHRLSSCKLSDHIILLDDGMIVEEGSHSELMGRDTQYRRMFELQANQYIGEDNNDD